MWKKVWIVLGAFGAVAMAEVKPKGWLAADLVGSVRTLNGDEEVLALLTGQTGNTYLRLGDQYFPVKRSSRRNAQGKTVVRFEGVGPLKQGEWVRETCVFVEWIVPPRTNNYSQPFPVQVGYGTGGDCRSVLLELYGTGKLMAIAHTQGVAP